jgi:cytochrome c553
MRMITPWLLAAALLPLSSGVAFSADAAAGRQLAARQCQVCHGLDGIAQIPIAPNIAGESAIYLDKQLRAFRTGTRENEMMSLVAKTLSDEDIANLGAWYESIRLTATMPE